MMFRIRLPMLCAVVFAAAGCYSYTPIQAPRPGMEVRAELETEAAVRHSQGLDTPVLRYDGMLVEVTPESYSLDVLVARSVSVFQEVEIRDTVRLPRTEVRTVMERKFSPVRSGLVAIAAAVGAAAIVMGIDAVVGGTGDENGDPPPPAIRGLFFRLTGGGVVPIFQGGGREE